MPSPDVAAYLGLELIEADEQELIATALERVGETFPDWTPREGNTEVVLLEALAGVVAEDVYAINRLTDGVTEALLRLFGLVRDQGTPPAASVRFTVTDNGGHTIPVGTTVRLALGDNVDPVDFTTDTDLTIAPGGWSGDVLAYAAEPTVEANGQPTGTVLELLDALSYINTVTLAAPASGGRVAEDGDVFLDRAVPILSRLTTTLVRPTDVEAYVTENAGATRVLVLDLYDPTDNASAPGRTPGHITVAVAGPNGSSLGSEALATIAAQIRTRMHAGLTIHVIDATTYTVDVDVVVVRFANADPATTEANVVAQVGDYLNPDTWTWDTTVRSNELIAAADRATGVDTVLAVTLALTGDPQAVDDVALPSYAPLARLGTVTVTVQAPT